MNHFVLARFGMKLWKGRVRAPWLYGAVMTHTPKLCFITYCLVNSNSWKASYINQHVGRRATVYFSGGARGGGRGKEKEVQNACSRRTWKAGCRSFQFICVWGERNMAGRRSSVHRYITRCFRACFCGFGWFAYRVTPLFVQSQTVWSTSITICSHA